MLECVTSCRLPGTVLFKDGQPVTKTMFQAQMEDAGDYVCAVIGQQSVLSCPVTLDVQCKYFNFMLFNIEPFRIHWIMLPVNSVILPNLPGFINVMLSDQDIIW